MGFPCQIKTANQRIALAAVVIFLLDQLTKKLVLQFIGYEKEVIVVDGFFKFVHWGNTGAAWSLFQNNNEMLTIVSLVTFLALFIFRKYFATNTPLGDYSMGLIFGGIVGNITDRFIHGYVVDFLFFHLYRRSGDLLGFPAFNIADSAICIGGFLLFYLSLQNETTAGAENNTTPAVPKTGE